MALLLVVVLFLPPASALACSCHRGFPPDFCEKPPADWDPAVFLGTVEWHRSIGPVERGEVSIRMRVEETFVGLPGEFLTLKYWVSDCNPVLQVGVQFLVVAHQREGKWFTTGCLGTRLASQSSLEVAALRAWRPGEPATRAIDGFVSDPHRSAKSFAGVKVQLNSPGINLEAITGSDGYYRFAGLPPGKYVVRIGQPGWKSDSEFGHDLLRAVDLTAKSCDHVYLGIEREKTNAGK